MQPGESIKRTLQRLGGKSVRMSSTERWKQRKAGVIDPNAALVVELTELTNGILTKMGNMDIYEEKYEIIKQKYGVKVEIGASGSGGSAAATDSLDMYADDFDEKEKSKIKPITDADLMKPPAAVLDAEIMWEFKWKADDKEIHGGFSSAQMQHWVQEGYFKDGVLVRKVGQTNTQFNTSNRIDFELYL